MNDDKEITANFEKKEDNGGTGIPGFMSILLLIAAVIAFVVYYRMKR